MAGAPEKYNADVLAAAEKYLDGDWEEHNAYPSVAGLARYLHKTGVVKVSRETLYNWAKDPEKQDWIDLMAMIGDEMEVTVGDRCIRKDYDSATGRLILAHRGYSEKHSLEHSGPGGGSIKTENTWVIQPVKVKDADSSDS